MLTKVAFIKKQQKINPVKILFSILIFFDIFYLTAKLNFQ